MVGICNKRLVKYGGRRCPSVYRCSNPYEHHPSINSLWIKLHYLSERYGGLWKGAHCQRNAGKLQMRFGKIEATCYRGAPFGHRSVDIGLSRARQLCNRFIEKALSGGLKRFCYVGLYVG